MWEFSRELNKSKYSRKSLYVVDYFENFPISETINLNDHLDILTLKIFFPPI